MATAGRTNASAAMTYDMYRDCRNSPWGGIGTQFVISPIYLLRQEPGQFTLGPTILTNATGPLRVARVLTQDIPLRTRVLEVYTTSLRDGRNTLIILVHRAWLYTSSLQMLHSKDGDLVLYCILVHENEPSIWVQTHAVRARSQLRRLTHTTGIFLVLTDFLSFCPLTGSAVATLYSSEQRQTRRRSVSARLRMNTGILIASTLWYGLWPIGKKQPLYTGEVSGHVVTPVPDGLT